MRYQNLSNQEEIVWIYLYHVRPCMTSDCRHHGSLRINSRLHARSNNQLSHPIPCRHHESEISMRSTWCQHDVLLSKSWNEINMTSCWHWHHVMSWPAEFRRETLREKCFKMPYTAMSSGFKCGLEVGGRRQPRRNLQNLFCSIAALFHR